MISHNNKYKVLYTARTQPSDLSAQAGQVNGMIQAFPSKKVQLKVLRRTNTLKGKLYFYSKLLFLVSLENYDLVIARDLIVCIILIFHKVKIMYEAHTIPQGLIRRIHSFLSHFRNIYLGAVSKSILKYYAKNFNYKTGFIIRSGISSEPRKCSISLYKYLTKVLENMGFNKHEYTLVIHTGNSKFLFDNGIKCIKDILDNEKFLFLQIGGLEEEYKVLKSKLQDKQANRFIWHKSMSHKDTLEVQCIADLLLYTISPKWPTYKYISPTKSIEYLASGNPVIGTSGGGVGEIFDEAKTYTTEDIDNHQIKNNIIKYQKEISKISNIAYHNYLLTRNYFWEERWERILKHCF